MRKLPVLLLTTAAALVTPAFAQDKPADLHQAMSKSMKEMQSMKMTGDVDPDFAMMMKHHHQSGVDMARVQVRDGKDPEMKEQAQKIIDAQTKEIAELDRWLQAHKANPAAKRGGESSSSGQSSHSGHEKAK